MLSFCAEFNKNLTIKNLKMLKQLYSKTLILFCFIIVNASPHKHSHGSKERLQDEIDQHYAGGEHHSEFDHEVIKIFHLNSTE